MLRAVVDRDDPLGKQQHSLFGATVAGLFVLRARIKSPAPFRTPGYPWLPALFVLVAVVVVISTIVQAPGRSAIGALLLLAGVPVYYFFKRQTGART